jgi:hypothetical protein
MCSLRKDKVTQNTRLVRHDDSDVLIRKEVKDRARGSVARCKRKLLGMRTATIQDTPATIFSNAKPCNLVDATTNVSQQSVASTFSA